MVLQYLIRCETPNTKEVLTQLTFACSKSTIETIEKGVKNIHS